MNALQIVQTNTPLPVATPSTSTHECTKVIGIFATVWMNVQKVIGCSTSAEEPETASLLKAFGQDLQDDYPLARIACFLDFRETSPEHRLTIIYGHPSISGPRMIKHLCFLLGVELPHIYVMP